MYPIGRLRMTFRPSPATMSLLLALAALHSPAAASQCKPVRFKPGASSANIRGTVEPEQQKCFSFYTARGQSVSLTVKSTSGNVAFSINGLADNLDHFEFTSEKNAYKFFVYQTIKSASAEPYALSLTIR